MSRTTSAATMAITVRYSAAAAHRQRWSAWKKRLMALTSKTRANTPTGTPIAGPMRGRVQAQEPHRRQARQDDVDEQAPGAPTMRSRS